MRRIQRFRRLLPVPLGAVLVLAFVAATAVLANHIPGALYTGGHAGGGTVEFEVSADGSGVTGFTAMNIPGNTCTFPESTVTYDPPLPINNHSFSAQSNPGLSIEGSFPAPAQAEGTLRARQIAIPPFIPACDSGEIAWTATTDAPIPTPTPPAIAKGDVDCDGNVNSVDALKELRHVAGLSVSQDEPCPNIGSEFASIFGDMDCDEDVDSVDALRILRFVVELPANLPAGCAPIGE